MQLEFHQLDRRWEHLRVREPHRQRRLLASLAESGQQTPIVVVVSEDNRQRYLVIDGHKRVAALEQLGRDTVEATVWEMSAAEALLLSRSLRSGPQETAQEQGWLLAELARCFGYSLEELARRFDRSVSWVSRRLALVELLPEAIQQQVREGKIATQAALKYLVPMARVNADHCQKMAAVFAAQHCDTRQAGQLYAAWREGSRVTRERLLAEPELFLKTQRQPPAVRPAALEQMERDLEIALAILRRAGRRLGEALAQMNGAQQEQTQGRIENALRELNRMAERIGRERETEHAEPDATHHDSGTEHTGDWETRDRAAAADLPGGGAPSAALQRRPGAGTATGGESRTLPAADPRALGHLPGKPRASP